ncbi:DUF4747 family protein [Gracilibacillus suaedae]|uniref:DUF4747 family protein n=1 Tax=Gracilibacillus suaedae TaxID=2820273 RepID=UPI001ABED7C8|nr:DUF4747 family protein [Gracilibacillus suaedae]
MSITLYFSKININSHIFNVYNDRKEMQKIFEKLYINIKDGILYGNETVGFDESGKEYHDTTVYKFYSILKFSDLDYTITGKIVKKMTIFINDLDEETGEMINKPTSHTEVIDFYFDILKEIVCFHTTNRFGFKEFNDVFKELINRSMFTEDEEYYFKVSLWREGLELNDIKKQLKKIGNIESLKIDITPPNPDDEILDNIQENGEEYLESIKEGNITQRSILFNSKAPQGLKLNSKMVNQELDRVDNVHSSISSETAIQRGYIHLSATSKNGRTFTTEDSRPVKDTLTEKPSSQRDFALACKDKVNALLTYFT